MDRGLQSPKFSDAISGSWQIIYSIVQHVKRFPLATILVSFSIPLVGMSYMIIIMYLKINKTLWELFGLSSKTGTILWTCLIAAKQLSSYLVVTKTRNDPQQSTTTHNDPTTTHNDPQRSSNDRGQSHSERNHPRKKYQELNFWIFSKIEKHTE